MKIKYKSGTKRGIEIFINNEKTRPKRYHNIVWERDAFSKFKTSKGFYIKVNEKKLRKVFKKHYTIINTGKFFTLKAKK